MNQVTGPEDLLGAAGGGTQGFRATDVTAQEERFLWRTGARRLRNAVTSPRKQSRHRKIREAARKLLAQHIPSLAPKARVSRCASVLFISQKPDALPAPWKLLTNPEQLPSQSSPTPPHLLHCLSEVELWEQEEEAVKTQLLLSLNRD